MRRVLTTIIGEQDIFQTGLAATLALSRFKVARNMSFDKRLHQADAKGAGLVLIVEPRATHKAAEEAIRSIRATHPHSCIVLLASQATNTRWAFDAGADGCLPRTISAHALVAALELLLCREVSVGTIVSSPKQPEPEPATWIATPMSVGPSGIRLSQREREVLSCVARGDSNKRIARALEICEATVKGHIRTVLRKIGASNRTQAAMMANELLTPTLMSARVNGHC